MNAINEKPKAAKFDYLDVETSANEIRAIAETLLALSKSPDDVPARSAYWIGDRLFRVAESLDTQVDAYCRKKQTEKAA